MSNFHLSKEQGQLICAKILGLTRLVICGGCHQRKTTVFSFAVIVDVLYDASTMLRQNGSSVERSLRCLMLMDQNQNLTCISDDLDLAALTGNHKPDCAFFFFVSILLMMSCGPAASLLSLAGAAVRSQMFLKYKK